ncbi:hypothetical protein GCM10009416_14780 [Craurococcus roseus]|uniref:Uncharacterized protein n=1 Tax=Craurococcus roseus TaxID=77585 RepID=A0ABP3Q323_9PROT
MRASEFMTRIHDRRIRNAGAPLRATARPHGADCLPEGGRDARGGQAGPRKSRPSAVPSRGSRRHR